MIRCYNISKKSCEHSNSWMLSGWGRPNGLTRGSKGAMWIRGDLFKLIVGVRWMIGRSYLVILTNDGDARLASTFVLCPLFAAIWDAVTGSSLIRGCSTFLACHEQSRQHSSCPLGSRELQMQDSHPIFSSSSCLHTIIIIVTLTRSQSVNIPHFASVFASFDGSVLIWMSGMP